jgi:hypothetical protein
LERDYTETNHQASLAIKSTIAQMINTILIPFISNRFIKNNVAKDGGIGNIYGSSGLTDNVFMLSITTSLLPAVLTFFDPFYAFVRIKAWFKQRPSNYMTIQDSKLSQTQR